MLVMCSSEREWLLGYEDLCGKTVNTKGTGSCTSRS
eukprot:XP_001707918.1 Hypothetical protein GL50803_35153 [Giardia lamblia ATCC 50803]